jgi:hypothetical protein
MWLYLKRWQQRQRELAQGADADLVRENRKRGRFGFGLLAFSFIFAACTSKMQLPHLLRTIIGGSAIASLVVGFVMLQWAKWEKAFLDRPDQEKPPSILKD